MEWSQLEITETFSSRCVSLRNKDVSLSGNNLLNDQFHILCHSHHGKPRNELLITSGPNWETNSGSPSRSPRLSDKLMVSSGVTLSARGTFLVKDATATANLAPLLGRGSGPLAELQNVTDKTEAVESLRCSRDQFSS